MDSYLSDLLSTTLLFVRVNNRVPVSVNGMQPRIFHLRKKTGCCSMSAPYRGRRLLPAACTSGGLSQCRISKKQTWRRQLQHLTCRAMEILSFGFVFFLAMKELNIIETLGGKRNADVFKVSMKHFHFSLRVSVAVAGKL